MKAPTHETHIPLKAEIPPPPEEIQAERPYVHPPNLWQEGVKCKHKVTGQEAIVIRIDLGTMQFRPYYPETQTHASRTEWQACAEWQVETTLSPKEVARQEALKQLQAEMAALDKTELAWASVLAADDDPAKSLAKLEAMRAGGFLKGKPETVAAATEGKRAK